MSELTEQRWAVLSERGCEATSLSYPQATELMRSLMREKVSGLFIVTDNAARRATHKVKPQTRHANLNGAGSRVKVKG